MGLELGTVKDIPLFVSMNVYLIVGTFPFPAP